MAIRNIVFDMGNVLIHDDMPAYIAGYLDDENDCKLVFQELMSGLEWTAWDRGTMNVEEVSKAVEERLPKHLHGVSAKLMNGWHMQAEPVEGIADLIKQLKENGYGVYILSNTAITYYAYRHILPAIEFFDGEFISADHNVLKPEIEIYNLFTKTHNLQPAECFFVDDLLVNIQGAQAAGWQGFCFKKNIVDLKQALQEAGVNIS